MSIYKAKGKKDGKQKYRVCVNTGCAFHTLTVWVKIARRLGHSNIEITWAVYSHLYPREEERAIAVLNNV